MTAGGMGPRAFTASCSFALVSFARASRKGKGFRSRCWLVLGSAMGPRCACRGEAGVVRGGRGANGRGGHGSSCLRRIMSICSGFFCQGFRKGKSFRSGCWLPLGSAMGPRCACPGEAGGKCENKTSLIVDRKKYFPKKGNFKKKCFHELKGPSECAFPVSDQESTYHQIHKISSNT